MNSPDTIILLIVDYHAAFLGAGGDPMPPTCVHPCRKSLSLRATVFSMSVINSKMIPGVVVQLRSCSVLLYVIEASVWQSLSLCVC